MESHLCYKCKRSIEDDYIRCGICRYPHHINCASGFTKQHDNYIWMCSECKRTNVLSGLLDRITLLENQLKEPQRGHRKSFGDISLSDSLYSLSGKRSSLSSIHSIDGSISGSSLNDAEEWGCKRCGTVERKKYRVKIQTEDRKNLDIDEMWEVLSNLMALSWKTDSEYVCRVCEKAITSSFNNNRIYEESMKALQENSSSTTYNGLFGYQSTTALLKDLCIHCANKDIFPKKLSTKMYLELTLLDAYTTLRMNKYSTQVSPDKILCRLCANLLQTCYVSLKKRNAILPPELQQTLSPPATHQQQQTVYSNTNTSPREVVQEKNRTPPTTKVIVTDTDNLQQKDGANIQPEENAKSVPVAPTNYEAGDSPELEFIVGEVVRKEFKLLVKSPALKFVETPSVEKTESFEFSNLTTFLKKNCPLLTVVLTAFSDDGQTLENTSIVALAGLAVNQSNSPVKITSDTVDTSQEEDVHQSNNNTPKSK